MPDLVLELLLCLLIPFAHLGLALVNTGLNRTRSAAHTVLSALCAGAVAVVSYVVLGSAIAGSPGKPGLVLHLGGKSFSVAGAGKLFARGVSADDAHGCVVLLFGLLTASLVAQIPVAVGGERWRLSATCCTAAFAGAFLFPLVSCWFWGPGFLSPFASPAALGQTAVDVGGAGSVQLTGGALALVIAWLLGPRQGKFNADGMPTAMPGHNAVIVVVGCLLALLGWIGLGGAGALLFYRATAGDVAMCALNSLVAASGGAIAALITTRVRFGKPDTSLTGNGWVCGLVAASAGSPFFKIPEALLIGLAAGFLVVLAIEVIELRMQIDDPAGAIAVHGAGGILGLLSVALLGSQTGHASGQFLALGTALGFVLPISYLACSGIGKWTKHRVEAAGERQGIDLYELGAGAYPEFVTHREDAYRR